MRNWWWAPACIVLAICHVGHASPITRGTNEVRPVLGATAGISNQQNQGQVGVDWFRSLNGPLGFVLGYWVGFGESVIGMELHAGVKYRFLKLNPRLAPFLMVGGGFTAGFPTEGPRGTVTALGARFGGGIDFFVTERIVSGLQVAFDLGPRFTPDVGFHGSVQIALGCGFLL